MILDVREADELQEGKIDGAVNIPLGQLIRKARHGDIDDLKGKKIITYCNSGYRGNIAADEFHVTGVQGDVSSLGDLKSFVPQGETAERPNRSPLCQRRGYWIITIRIIFLKTILIRYLTSTLKDFY